MAKNNDFYKDAAKELADHTEFQIEYIKWIENGLKSTIQKYKYACQDNDNLRTKIINYEGGMIDAEMVQAQIPNYKWHNPKSVGNDKGYQVRGYEWKMPVVADDLDLPEVPLNDILSLCKTDTQREVASYYYDQKLDCYNSFQKTADAVSKSRQSVYGIIITIQKRIKAKMNK